MTKKPHILIVEDSNEDYQSTLRAFKEVNLASTNARCDNGDEALDYLYRRAKYSDPGTSPRPTMILLDLNLPGTDGRSVLKKIKNDPSLCMIPVTVLTTSADERDIEHCYSEGANSYLQKPVRFLNFVESIRRLKDYWFEIVLFPDDEKA